MSTHSTRPAGWYWVRKAGWDGKPEPWVPAEWRPDFCSWRSCAFSGIPDAEIQVGLPLRAPAEERGSTETAEQLRAERDEADRRAGAAERQLASEVDARIRRNDWLHKAKQAWGAETTVSFDQVWAEALALKLTRQETSANSPQPLQVEWAAAFETWWESHGQFCRSGGGAYEKTFAYRAWEAALKRFVARS